jgi:hypothetical protein
MSAAAPLTNDAWFVSANSRVFGPYSREQMRDYISQKRVTATSLVRFGDVGDFVPASMHAALARQFEPQNLASSSTRSAPVARRVEPASGAAAAEGVDVYNYVIIIEFNAGSSLQFETELKKLGRTYRVNRLVWLLQSEQPANSIKTALAPFIGVKDPLLIVDAAHNRLAWHNFGVLEASSIRDLWKLPHERG